MVLWAGPFDDALLRQFIAGEAGTVPLARWQALLSVFVRASTGSPPAEQIPMQGNYDWVPRARSIRFIPTFPLEPGVTYFARCRPDALGVALSGAAELTHTLRIPSAARPRRTTITQIHPSAPELPENLLKFYLHFSAPMSRGHIYDFIHLRTRTGREIEIPFLEIDEELWDRSMQRLTLFIDPGRIKRGVRPLEEVGPALEAGEEYELVVDSAWKDASGAPLRAGFTKRFRVTAADREPLTPTRWTLKAPRTSTRRPLTVDFGEPLDAALLARCLEVIDAAGNPVAGRSDIEREERRWSFQPTSPWTEGDYALRVARELEDLAGNNVGKTFEVDLFDTSRSPANVPSSLVPFKTVSPRSHPAPSVAPPPAQLRAPRG